MKKAVWGTDYDYRTDKCFQRPCCPECNDLIPVFRTDKKHPELAECISCHKVVLLTDEMRKWFSKREEVKTKTETCLKCGKKDYGYTIPQKRSNSQMAGCVWKLRRMWNEIYCIGE